MTQVSENDRRALYEVTDPSGQDEFDIDFPLDDANDIEVYVDGILIEPEDYTVNLTTLKVTLDTDAEEGSFVALEGRRQLERETGYPLRGTLRSGLLNDDMNAIYYALQEQRRDIDRSLQLARDVPDDVNPAIPAPEASRVIVGNQAGDGFENGPLVADVAAVAENIDSLNAVNDALDEIVAVAANIGGVNTIGTVAGAIANVNLVGGSIASVNTVADAIAAVNTVSGIAANVTTVAGIALAVVTVAGIAAAVSAVSAVAANVTTVAGISANVTTAAGNSANINAVAGISASVTTVAGMAAEITAVIADATDIGIVASNIADINTVADVLTGSPALTSIAGLTTVADLMIYTTGSNTYATTALTSAARALLDDANAAAMLVTLGAQGAHANLTAFAGLSLVADRLPYANGTGTLSLATFTAAARSLLDDANAATMLTTLGAQAAISGASLTAVTVATDDKIVIQDTSDSNNIKTVTAASIAALANAVPSGTIIQSLGASYSSNADLSTTIPADDTIPQNTEGTEIVTVTITPTSATSTIEIEFAGGVAGGASVMNVAALFKDSGANALQVSAITPGSVNLMAMHKLIFRESAANTTARTYKIRVGQSSGTMRMNGTSSARLYGGAMAAFLIVREVKG